MRKIFYFIIVLIIVLVALVFGYLYFQYSEEDPVDPINSLELQSKTISREQYDSLSYKDYYNDYRKSLSPNSKGITLKFLQNQNIDITEENRICFVHLDGTVLPDESKFVFAVDFVTKKPESPVPPCDHFYDASYNFYIFDANTRKITPLPDNSVPTIWIDENNLLYEQTTTNPNTEDYTKLKTNLYLYKLSENRYVKLSSQELPYERKDLQEFAISPDKEKIFIQYFNNVFSSKSDHEQLIIPLESSKEELRINIKECSKIERSGVIYRPCNDFFWSKDGKSILYSHEDFQNRDKSFKIIDIY